MVQAGKAGFGSRRNTVSWIAFAALALSARDGGFSPRDATRAGSVLELTTPASGRVVDRDVPAPQVFDLTEPGLWDGRPSLGGVWVAHPTARDPERVIIRNTQTGTEVIGALFRRERENPGPRYQISSEAAGALGILAGQPASISVIALRVERIEPAAASAAAAVPPATNDNTADVPPQVSDSPSALTETPVPAAAQQDVPQNVPQDAQPRRGLRDIFARPTPQDAPATPVTPQPDMAADAGAAPVPPTPLPATAVPDRVDIIALDPEPPAPRRSLRDMFRRDGTGAGTPQDTGITQTALAPAAPLAAPLSAPLAATPLLMGAGDGGVAPAPGRLTDPVVAEPGPQAMAAPSGARGLRDLFRRQPAQPALAPADTTLIPMPDTVPIPAAVRANQAPAPAAQAPAAQARARAPAAPSQIGRPFVQIGIFSIEANADRTRAQMRAAGLPAEIRPGRAGETPFWRVVIGPAADAATHAEHLRRARAAGFADAYAVVR